MSAIQELKAGTRDLHESIEKVVPLLDPALTIEVYIAYLQQLFPFYQWVEQNLRCVPSLRATLEDLDERWRTGLLAIDLKGLRKACEFSLEPSLIPQPRNVPEALGCLYVLEGSTLGAQILVRAVSSRLGAAVDGRTNFLQSYGPALSEKWRGLCGVLNSALAEPNDLHAAVLAARSTFDNLRKWLVCGREQMKTMRGALSQ